EVGGMQFKAVVDDDAVRRDQGPQQVFLGGQAGGERLVAQAADVAVCHHVRLHERPQPVHQPLVVDGGGRRRRRGRRGGRGAAAAGDHGRVHVVVGVPVGRRRALLAPVVRD